MKNENYTTEVKKWLNTGESVKSAVKQDKYSDKDIKTVKKTVFGVANAYCEFQDIVSGKKIPEKNVWEHLDELDEWVSKKETV